jgi:hypothetical protein
VKDAVELAVRLVDAKGIVGRAPRDVVTIRTLDLMKDFWVAYLGSAMTILVATVKIMAANATVAMNGLVSITIKESKKAVMVVRKANIVEIASMMPVIISIIRKSIIRVIRMIAHLRAAPLLNLRRRQSRALHLKVARFVMSGI